MEQTSVAMKSEIDMYCEEPLIPRSSDIDILSYWRTCSVRYPILAQMAKDVLVVPVFTVASESAFSTGSRVLDCYRSSLKLETVEAIICLRNWAFGKDCMDPQLEMLCGSIMKLEVEKRKTIHFHHLGLTQGKVLLHRLILFENILCELVF